MTEQQDAQPGPWEIVTRALIFAVGFVTLLMLCFSASYAIALHGLSPG